ncbi:MAG: helix-turn-helix domain-containing protein [Verrucomicrobiota bacterium]
MQANNSVSTATSTAAEVFDDAAACVYLATNPRMLRKMRQEYGLPFCRISSKSLRYRRRDLEEWLARRRVAISA